MGLLKTVEFYQAGAGVSEWIVLLYGALVSGVVSYFCIHYFLKLIERVGYLPFVVYRIALGSGVVQCLFSALKPVPTDA